MRSIRLPHLLIGVGLLLIGVMAVEVFVMLSRPPIDMVEIINMVATVPFLAMLGVASYWLFTHDVDADRYPRMASWVVAGFVLVGGIFFLIAIFTQDDLWVRIGIVRWSAVAGIGMGAMIGVFEAKAIDQASATQRIQIRNEELYRQNERMGDFVGAMAHDLKNPLNVANGYLDIARADPSEEHFDRISGAHERIEDIIDETLALARSGQVIGETEPVSLTEIAERCWMHVSTRSATIEIADQATFMADPDRLQHLFENLFRNAVEHGGSDVTVRVGTLSNGFYVEDDGAGIPKDLRETIFESGYTTKERGSGYGLTVVNQIVEAHDWEITVTDNMAGGARFEITDVEFAD